MIVGCLFPMDINYENAVDGRNNFPSNYATKYAVLNLFKDKDTC